MDEIPESDATWNEITQFALTYNAYERWYGDLGTVAAMLSPLQSEFDSTGEIPLMAGSDALRAWLFVLIRSDRFTSGITSTGAGTFVLTDPPENPAVRKIISALRDRGVTAESH